MTQTRNPKIPFGILKGFRLSDLIAGGDTGADYLAKARYYHTIPQRWQDLFAWAYLQTPQHLGTLKPYSLNTEKALLLRLEPGRAHQEIENFLFEKRLRLEAQVLWQQTERTRRTNLLSLYAPQLTVPPEALQAMVAHYGIPAPWQGNTAKEALYTQFPTAYYTASPLPSLEALPPDQNAYSVAYIGEGVLTHAIKGYASLCGKRVRRDQIRYVEEAITCQRCLRYLALCSQPQ